MSDFETIIGLEVHVQLNTASRLFSAEPANGQALADPLLDPDPGLSPQPLLDPDRERDGPNALSGPYAMGHPGTYPVLNAAAVDAAVRLGLTFDCRINTESEFDRKHYFYPDLPRGYQITQHRTPVCEDGVYVSADASVSPEASAALADPDGSTGADAAEAPDQARIRIRRIHLEEDAGRLIHHHDRTLVDYDRSGISLLELVTEPDFRSGRQAAQFLRDLRDIVRTLGICDGRLEDGSLRCDANVSIRRTDGTPGARVEIKNMNSFRHVERAIEFEARRQQDLEESGRRIDDETRRYDADADATAPLRSKESAPDYRFIPEPDLPPVRISRKRIEVLSAGLPERPDRRRRRLVERFGLSDDWARLLTSHPSAAGLFDEAEGLLDPDAPDGERASSLCRRMAAVLVEQVVTAGRAVPPPAALVDVAVLVEDRRIDAGSVGGLLDLIGQAGPAPDVEGLARSGGMLLSLDDDDLDPFIRRAVREHPDEWRRYVGGKKGLLGFFVGRILRSLDEPADPATVSERIEELSREQGDADTGASTGRRNPPESSADS